MMMVIIGAFTLLTSRFLKSRHFDPTIYTCAKNREVSVSRNFVIFWLVVRMCDHIITGYSACIHACSACSMHEGRGYRYTFQRARVSSSPEVPKVTWWKIATFLGYHLHWLTSRHFRKIALRLGIFLPMFRECLCVVARQLAPKCRDFSNVAKLARQCKWPYWWLVVMVVMVMRMVVVVMMMINGYGNGDNDDDDGDNDDE